MAAIKRIIIVCEGQTEQTFVKQLLAPPLLNMGLLLQAPIIKASKGGIVKWGVLKKQIETHLKQESDACVSTFIDYYGTLKKHEFPGWEAAHKLQDKKQRMDALEQAMLQAIDSTLQHRFIPYIQLHEFEGLLFNDLGVIENCIPAEDLTDKAELSQILQHFPNPELINDTKASSPSHRLTKIIRGYHKVVHGLIIAEDIGLQRIRAKSPQFNAWVSQLEAV